MFAVSAARGDSPPSALYGQVERRCTGPVVHGNTARTRAQRPGSPPSCDPGHCQLRLGGPFGSSTPVVIPHAGVNNPGAGCMPGRQQRSLTEHVRHQRRRPCRRRPRVLDPATVRSATVARHARHARLRAEPTRCDRTASAVTSSASRAWVRLRAATPTKRQSTTVSWASRLAIAPER